MIYRPREDSYLLKEYIESLDLEGKKLLDVGTGTGILAVAAAEKGAEVVASDINPEALEIARENALDREVDDRIEFVESDLFENIEDRFDVIVFNPPYLPGNDYRELEGGKTGVELTERFLEEVGEYLEEGGFTVFIASSRSDIERLGEKFEIEKLDARKLWFETLYLFRNK